MNKTDTGDDATLTRLLDAATHNIDRACNRPDGFVAESNASARTYKGSGASWQWIDECVEVTLIRTKSAPTSAYTTWAPTDWIACT
ncbi:MAG: hypothetical protein E3J37_02335, partial [Anaerolineales bacterium]